MNRSLLRHPAIIGGVVVGLLAVTVLNLRTFAPRAGMAGHGLERVVGHLVPPSDLSGVVRDAVYGRGDTGSLARSGMSDSAAALRDPFTGGTVRPEAAPTPATRPQARRARTKAAPLACTAVMLGGHRPLALIGGKAYGPGDSVQGHEVQSIDAEGVHLRGADGHVTTLAVGSAPADAASFHVVTRIQEPTDAGRTRLAADRPERNDR